MDTRALFFPQQLVGGMLVLATSRTGTKEIAVHTPDGKVYNLAVDGKDNRMLAIVDGDIVTGGLTDNAEVIFSEVLSERLVVSADNAYAKRAGYEEAPTHVVWRSHAHQTIRRHAILFALSASVLLRRYDIKTLSPQYVTVTLKWEEGRESFVMRPVFVR